MARHRLLLAALSILFCAHTTLSQSGITRVWAVDDGEKIKRDDLAHWAAASPDNAVWDGSTIRLSGARNEIVAFQLILEASGAGAFDVNVFIDSLAGPGYVITNSTSNSDPFNFVGRRIELFLEHYLNVSKRSTAMPTAWDGAYPLPHSDHLGWIPDALVPFQARPGTADWVGGAPFVIGGSRNQGVWVDITIPRDAPAGVYRTTARVTEAGRTTFAIPLELQVYGFTLPDSTHFHNMFFLLPELLTRHPGITAGSQEYWQLFQKYMHLARRHRIDLSDSWRTLNEFDRHLKDYYTGIRFTQAYGYDGPGVGVGNTTYSIGTYDQPNYGWASGFSPNTPEAWWAAADAWEGWFRANAPNVVRFKYMIDEPGHDTATYYPIIRERAGWMKSNPGIGRDLLTYCTVKMDPRLAGYIDFWSLTGQSAYDNGDGILEGYVVSKANERRARGEKVGIYGGNRPSFGIFEWIDNVATDPRVIPWVSWKYNVDQYFFWETGFLYNTTATKLNPWVALYEPQSNGKLIWGLGNVLYTGNDNLFPDESRGIDGPIASIRIKNWRRGQQDYEYLLLAQQAGIDTRTLVDQIVPAAFDDYQGDYTSQDDQAVFADRGFKFERARKVVGELLDGTPKADLPQGTFNAQPHSLPPGGGSVTLQWTSQNASEARIDQGVGPVLTQGSQSVTVTESTVFKLTLSNQNGSITLSASVAVSDTTPTAPTGVFSASPRILENGGGDVTLTWESANATGAILDNGIGAVPLSGSRTVHVASNTTFTLTLTKGSLTTILRDSVRVANPPPTPTGTFSANPTLLAHGGGAVTLSWASQGATTASLDQGIGAVEFAGSRTVTVTQPTLFTLSLSNGVVTTLLQTKVEIDTTPPRPEGTFTATPSTVPYGGGDVTLNWSSVNATSASIDQGIGPVALSGSQTVRVTAGTTFGLALSNTAHQETLRVNINVAPPPPPLRGNFELAPALLPPGGGDIVLSWWSENATAAFLDNGIGTVPLSGTRSHRVERSTTFVLTLVNSSDTLTFAQDLIVEEALAPPEGVLAILPSYLPEGGGEVKLFWSTEKAARVSIDHGVGTVPINGSMRVYVGASTQFTITIENSGGTIQRTASVAVASSTVRGVPSIVRNPDFETGTNQWHFQSDGVGAASAEQAPQADGMAAHIVIQQPGSIVQFYQPGLPLEPQTRYQLQFDAWSSSGHDMDVFIHQHYSPFASYGLAERQLNLEPVRKTFSTEFVTENMETPVADGRLRFWLGPHAAPGDEYWIDNVLLRKLERVIVPLHAPVLAFPATKTAFMPATVQVTWNRVPGASHYHLQVAHDSTFRSLVLEDSSLVDTVASVGPFNAGSRFFLRVRAVGSASEGAYSPIYAFVTEPASVIPQDYTVEQNYPNPFNAATVIRYSVPAPVHVSMRLYDILGREVAELVEGIQLAGTHQISVSSQALASGTYFYVFRAGGFQDVRKMVLMR